MYFTIENPYYLYGLFVIPLVIFFHFYGIKKVRGNSLNFANFEAIARIKGIDLYSKNVLLPILDSLFIVFLVFSLAGVVAHAEVETTEFSYVVAIDSSESMGATDFSPNRLDAAKIAAKGFLDEVPNSVMAVISFAGNTYIEQELTSDKLQLSLAIEGIELTDVGGTDIYEAVSTSSSLLKGEDNKAIILLSDGQINTMNVESVISLAKEEGIVIHTLGVGTLFGGETEFGTSKLDEDSLKALAYNTGGVYFNVQNESALLSSFKEIVPLTKKMGSFNLEVYLIALALLVFLLKHFLTDFVKVRI